MKGIWVSGLLVLAGLCACGEREAPEPPQVNLGGARIRVSEFDLASRSGSVLSATRDNNGLWQMNYLGSSPPRDIQKVLPPEEGQRLDALLRDRSLFVPAVAPEPVCREVSFEMKIDAGGRAYDNPGNCRPDDGPAAYVAGLLAEAVGD